VDLNHQGLGYKPKNRRCFKNLQTTGGTLRPCKEAEGPLLDSRRTGEFLRSKAVHIGSESRATLGPPETARSSFRMLRDASWWYLRLVDYTIATNDGLPKKARIVRAALHGPLQCAGTTSLARVHGNFCSPNSGRAASWLSLRFAAVTTPPEGDSTECSGGTVAANRRPRGSRHD